MDKIADVLTAQHGTSPLGQYNGNGAVAAERHANKLAELISALESLLASLPPDIAALLTGVLEDAQLVLASGSIKDVESMIDRLKAIIHTLMELMAQIQTSGGQMDFSQVQALLHGLAVEMDASLRSSLTMLLQNLRKLAAGNSLKGIDEVNLGSLDGSSLIEPSQNNVILSLQQLIDLAIARPINPTDAAQASLLQAGNPATAISAPPPPVS